MNTELLILEAARLALQSYFMQMQLAGKSEEEIDEIYAVERAEFLANKPEDLLKV